MKKVILAGNGITANILNEYLKNDSRYSVVATVVDDEFVKSNSLNNLPSIGISELLNHYPIDEVTIIPAAGYNNLNKVREHLFEQLKKNGYSFETYIHPDAKIFTTFPIGEGSVILPGSVIEPFVKIGTNTMIWCNVTLAHHSEIRNNCWIASGSVISGSAIIGNNTFVGVNATIVNEIEIKSYNVIGGGAMITKSTKESSVHLARSAEVFRYSSEDYAKYFGV